MARLLTAAAALLRLDPDDDALDEIPFGQWLAGRRQSDRAVDRLWNLIALPTLNASADEASLKLAVKVFRVGLLDRSDAGDIGWSSVPLAELHGGNARRALEGRRCRDPHRVSGDVARAFLCGHLRPSPTDLRRCGRRRRRRGYTPTHGRNPRCLR